EAAAAQVIEYADLLDQPDGMIERQQVHQWTKAQALGALRDGRQEHAGRWGRAEGRAVMFGKMVGIKAVTIVSLDQREPVLEVSAKRAAGVVPDGKISKPDLPLPLCLPTARPPHRPCAGARAGRRVSPSTCCGVDRSAQRFLRVSSTRGMSGGGRCQAD